MNNLIRIQGIAAALMLAALCGCKRHPDPPLTFIPGRTGSTVGTDTTARPLDRTPAVKPSDTAGSTDLSRTGTGETALGSRDLIEGMVPDREPFKTDTLYFDFDRAAVKASERSKADAVATALKAKPEAKLQVEGHCDERGTEEYNRSLGERRALAVREYLINSGVAADRVFTISYGEDKPADSGHNDEAWAKNRRAEFILLLPKP